jgi:23S rRNA (pseudouridine1915-N3)-methyltransferase
MTRIRIIAPGRVREPYLRDAIAAARRELARVLPVEIVEVEDSPDQWPVAKALAAEGERMRARLTPDDYIIALDLAGQWVKTDAAGTWRPLLERWLEQARGDLVFLIGGSHGLDPSLLRQAHERICLSQMTFTHQMARLILLEALIRALNAT